MVTTHCTGILNLPILWLEDSSHSRDDTLNMAND